MGRKLAELKNDVDSHIKSVLDFPKPGINFRDIMPLMAEPALVKELCEAIADYCKEEQLHIDLVAGLEARGFLFGPQVAMLLNIPFVPIRKKGKLPGEVVRASYIKEYGEDIVEIQKGVVKEGQRVLIIDDLLATGGTMKAAAELMRSVGGVVAKAVVLIELTPLNGRSVPTDVPIYSLLSYNDL